MRKNLKVLVLCANGAVTSTIVLTSLKEEFEKEGINASFVQKRVVDGAQALDEYDFDLVISTAGQDFAKDIQIPVLSGVPFLTGVGKDKIIDEVIRIADE